VSESEWKRLFGDIGAGGRRGGCWHRVNGDDVGVVESSGRAGLAQESLKVKEVGGKGRGKDSDGNAPLEPRIVAEVHDPHPALADSPQDQVFPERFSGPVLIGRHRSEEKL